jgi:hypothetical protein
MLTAELGCGKGNQSDYPFANLFCRERVPVVDLLRWETLLAGISERFLQCGGRVEIFRESLVRSLYASVSSTASGGGRGGR